MNTQRITISLPKYLYEELIRQVPSGKVSGFVARAIESRLLELDNDPIEEFLKLRKKFPKRQRENILKAIKKGRI